MEIQQALDAVRANNQAILTTIKADGRPQLSNVLAAVGDDGVIRVSTTADRAKYANLRRTPWAAIHVNGESFWSYAVVEGDVDALGGRRRPARRGRRRAGRALPRPRPASTRTGTTTARRWCATGAWSSGSPRPTPTACCARRGDVTPGGNGSFACGRHPHRGSIMSARTITTTAVLGAAALATTLAVTAPPSADAAGHHATEARHGLGAGREGHDPPRHDDVHEGCPVHRQLRLPRRASATSSSGTPPTAPASARRPTPTAAGQVPAARHQGHLQRGRQRRRRGHPARDRQARLLVLAHHAAARAPSRRQHLRLQRPRARAGQAARTSSKVNPSIPFWGGPTGIDTDGTAAGDQVYTYGNSSLRGGVDRLSPHTGVSLGDDAADGGWSHPLYTVTPGVPGDSGSAFMSADGKAIGVLSTLGLAPLPGVQQHRRPRQGARLREEALRPQGAAADEGHRAVLLDPVGRLLSPSACDSRSREVACRAGRRWRSWSGPSGCSSSLPCCSPPATPRATVTTGSATGGTTTSPSRRPTTRWRPRPTRTGTSPSSRTA